MRIVIIEDSPDRLTETVRHLNSICPQGCKVEVVFYDPQNDYGDKREELENKLACPVTIVDYWNFEEKLDLFYNDPDTFLIFDTDLDKGRTIEIFEYRVNVKYALRKKKKEEKAGQPHRIWFYTTVEHLKRAIERTFGEFAIEAGQSGASLNLNVEGCPTLCKALRL